MEPGCEEELPGAVGLQRRGQGTILLLQGTARRFPAIHLSHTCPEEWVRWEYLQKVGKTPPFPAKITSIPLKWPVVVPMHRELPGEGTLLPHCTCHCAARFFQIYPSLAV